VPLINWNSSLGAPRYGLGELPAINLALDIGKSQRRAWIDVHGCSVQSSSR
jgi:hypothetical protein